jgi:hypothetical protein
MEFEDGGGIFELAALVMAAVELDIAELIERLLELAGEAGAIQCEAGEEPVGVHDIEINCGLLCWWVGGALEHVGFEERDAIDAPGCVGELLDQLGFGWGRGLIFIHELAAVLLVCGRVL